MDSTTWLRFALGCNAIFSGISGVILLTLPSLVEAALGVNAVLIFQVIGVGLLLFAADLLHQATRQRMATWRALYASAADFIWVVGTVVLLVLLPNLFSGTGIQLMLGVAALVLLLGVWQFWAIGKVHQRTNGGSYRHCVLVDTTASADAMWKMIGDLGQISRYMPSLKASIIEQGQTPGVGAVRTCEDHRGRRWSEQCTEFRPGEGFVVRFVTEADDFPYPATKMRGGWNVMPAPQGSRIMVWWELSPKPRWLGRVIVPLLALQVDRSFPKIIEAMARNAGATSAIMSHRKRPSLVQLIPQLC